MCLCRHHENMSLLLQELHKKLPGIFPLSTSDFIEGCVCDTSDYKRMTGKCVSCSELKVFLVNYESKVEGDDMMSEVSWYQWESCDGRTVKVESRGTIEEAVCSVKEQMSKFLIHVCIKRNQSKAFEESKVVASNPEVAVVQLDFSENYTAEYQDEIQSAHWHQQQISMFTVVVWSAGTVQSFVIVSDNLVHDKLQVAYCVLCCPATLLSYTLAQ